MKTKLAPSYDEYMATAIYEFESLPSRYIHSSWYKELPHGGVLKKLANDSRSEKRISEYIISHYALGDVDSASIPANLLGIALNSPDDLKQLVLYAGASLYCKSIQRVIKKRDVHMLKACLGDSVYAYALNRAPFLLSSDLIVKNILDLPGHLIAERVLNSGVCCLGSALSELPSSFRQRVMFKLPVDCMPQFTSASADPRACTRLLDKCIDEVH